MGISHFLQVISFEMCSIYKTVYCISFTHIFLYCDAFADIALHRALKKIVFLFSFWAWDVSWCKLSHVDDAHATLRGRWLWYSCRKSWFANTIVQRSSKRPFNKYYVCHCLVSWAFADLFMAPFFMREQFFLLFLGKHLALFKKAKHIICLSWNWYVWIKC